MEQFIIRENIKRYRILLKGQLHELKRLQIQRLLQAEESKLTIIAELSNRLEATPFPRDPLQMTD